MPNPVFIAEKTMIEIDGVGVKAIFFSKRTLHAIAEHLETINGDKVKVVISSLTQKKVRSVEQNNYYRGVVIKILAEHFGYIGPGEKDDLHNQLRSMFLVKIGSLGEPTVESTTRLSTKIFELYLEAIRTWALREYQIRIPLPNEVEDADESDTYTKL